MTQNLHLYWDTSAIIPLLIEEKHTLRATEIAHRSHLNVISTLGFSEIMATLSRMPDVNAQIGRNKFLEDHQKGVWSLTQLQPSFKTIELFSSRYPLKGADLWHLSVFYEIKKEFPSIQLLTFDQQLMSTAQKEGFLYS